MKLTKYERNILAIWLDMKDIFRDSNCPATIVPSSCDPTYSRDKLCEKLFPDTNDSCPCHKLGVRKVEDRILDALEGGRPRC